MNLLATYRDTAAGCSVAGVHNESRAMETRRMNFIEEFIGLEVAFFLYEKARG